MAKAPKRIVTEVDVAASPEVIWDVITDLDSYAEWNPFIVRGSGEPRVGEKLDLRMRPPGGPAVPMKPRVIESSEPGAFEWLGHLGIWGIFDGRHRFEIEPTEFGSRVTHSEEFTGLAVPLMSRLLGKTKAGFEAMNSAMKERAERIAAVI